jgi:hypothetical protein
VQNGTMLNNNIYSPLTELQMKTRSQGYVNKNNTVLNTTLKRNMKTYKTCFHNTGNIANSLSTRNNAMLESLFLSEFSIIFLIYFMNCSI